MGFYRQGALLLLGIVGMVQGQRILFMGSEVIRPGADYEATVSSLSADPLSVTVSIVNNKTGAVINSQLQPIQSGTLASYVIPIPLTVSETEKYVVRVEDGGPGNLRYQNQTEVKVEKKSRSIFITTDKAIYKPGALVKFRAFAVNVFMRPRNDPLTVEMFDPKGNKIKQWLDQIGESGVVSGELQLSALTSLGNWKIKVTSGPEDQSITFKVDEYVLPKFEVEVSLNPSFIVASGTSTMSVTATVKAMYNIGTPVDGNLNVLVKAGRSWYNINSISIERKISGISSVEISFPPGAFSSCTTCSMVVDVAVVDLLSGENRTASTRLQTWGHAEKLDFLDGPKFLKPGLKSQFVLKITQQDGTPIQETGQVSVRVTESSRAADFRTESNTRDYTFPLPSSGILNFDHQTSANATNLNLQANFNGATANTQVSQVFKSFSNNSIEVQQTSEQSGTNGQVVFTVRATETLTKIFYQIISKKMVTGSGNLLVQPPSKIATIPILASTAMGPSSTIIVYYVNSLGEIIAASERFDVPFELKNQMIMTWDETTKRVKEKANLTITASPGSFIAVGAVDQSVLLLAESNDITLDRVISELETYDHKSSKDKCCGPVPIRGKRSIWFPFFSASDTARVIESAGLVFMTDARVYRGQQFYERRPLVMFGRVPLRSKSRNKGTVLEDASQEVSHDTHVRKLFPESWIWNNSFTGADGVARFTMTVPDTLTKWVTSAFALHPTDGLGIPPQRANLTAFIPFFTRVDKPYSVIRGEETTIKVLVFNYLGSTKNVEVVLETKPDYYVKESKTDNPVYDGSISKRVQVFDQKGASVEFIVIPRVLGTITLSVMARTTGATDYLEEPLLVEPEGRLVESNFPIFVNLKKGENMAVNHTFNFPKENLVDGSKLITISIIGDLLGTTLSGLQRLVRMPYGCGEQNMLTMTPNIYVRKYIEVTQATTAKLISDTTKYMEQGYQRELTYQRKDGSFSAFGDSDSSGSTWLTAFVVQSFKQAQAFVYVDNEILVKALKWLITKTYNLETGKFREVGNVIHKEMQGGSQNTMTAYVLIALEQCRDLAPSVPNLIEAMTGARQTLENSIGQTKDAYTLAIMAYALQLTGSSSAQTVLGILDGQAETMVGDEKYWNLGANKKNNQIELAAFVLLTYALRKDNAQALPVARYLMSAKNPSGGFYSTQDTVWALNALTEFSAQFRSANQAFTVGIHVNTHSLYQYSVNDQKSSILRRYEVSDKVMGILPQTVSVTVTGTGSGLVELSSRYYTTKEEDNPKIKLSVQSKPRNDNVREVTSCLSVLDPALEDMFVVQIKDASGYPVDTSTISHGNNIKRVEKDGRETSIYFGDFPPNQEQCVTMLAYKERDVENTRPPIARAFGYYSGEETVISYSDLSGPRVETTAKMGTTKGGTGHADVMTANTILTMFITILTLWLTRN